MLRLHTHLANHMVFVRHVEDLSALLHEMLAQSVHHQAILETRISELWEFRFRQRPAFVVTEHPIDQAALFQCNQDLHVNRVWGGGPSARQFLTCTTPLSDTTCVDGTM